MSKIDWKDVGIRAGKTFLQAAVGAVVALLPTVSITDIEAAKAAALSLGIAMLSAGVSAAWNIIRDALKGVESNGNS